MSELRSPSPEERLAEGFAQHVAAWGVARGASAETLAALRDGAFYASLATATGHVCTHLAAMGPVDAPGDSPGNSPGNDMSLRALLLASRLVGVPDAPHNLPLILDTEGRLYLHRYFDYERRLALALMARVDAVADVANDARVGAHLRRLFSANASRLGKQVDWQKIAAALAYIGRLTIISGGPGTGKTTTVVNLLACLLAENPGCRVALAAPTGKAATRMLETIRRQAHDLPLDLQAGMPSESFTVHRLLGVTTRPGMFRHHAGNPLPIDVLIVDEASMLDLALAAKLLDAAPAACRVVMLGDKDQLAAVESGSVFAELCADPSLSVAHVSRLASLTGIAATRIATAQPSTPTPLRNHVIWLTENFRFSNDSGIGRLADDVKRGDAAAAMSWLRAGVESSVGWVEDAGTTPALSSLDRVFAGYRGYVDAVRRDASDTASIFEAFGRFRVLCAERAGPRGVAAINELVSRNFRQALGRSTVENERSEWYVGRPVMVLRNDYVLGLFNGDVGIVLPHEAGVPMLLFPHADGGYRAVSAVRIPERETAFASTVHKAQGSEFDEILLMLPSQPSRAVSRELLYTAVTRARARVTLVSGADVLAQAIDSPTQRHSGLISRLREVAARPEP